MHTLKNKMALKSFAGLMVAGISLLPTIAVAQIGAIKIAPENMVAAVGMSKFVAAGTVVSSGKNSVSVQVGKTSANAPTFKGKVINTKIDANTRVSKNGKTVSATSVKPGTTVKVYGIYDKKTGAITKTRWVQVDGKGSSAANSKGSAATTKSASSNTTVIKNSVTNTKKGK